MQKQTVLVTGAAGFIGANLVRKLVSQKNQVWIIIKKSTNLWRLSDIISKVKLQYINLDDSKNLEKFINKIKPQIIYHLAAHGNYSFHSDQIQMIQTNLINTANLLHSLRNIDYKCFINTGSSSEYGFKKKPMKETDLLEPASFYAATKAAGTYLCQVLAKSYNKPIITFRPFSVYGPYEEPTRLIPTVIVNVLRGKPVQLTINKARRDFIYVDDLVDCYLNAPSSIIKRIYGETFNIGTGTQYTNEEVVEIAAKHINKKVKVIKGIYPNRSWDTNFWVGNISKVKKIMHWKPKHSLDTGMKKTIDWFIKYEKIDEIYN